MKYLKELYTFTFVYMPLHKYQAYATFWPRTMFVVRNLTRYALMLTLIATLTYSGFLTSHVFFPRVEASAPIEVIKEVAKKAPVMDRIADCESGDRVNGRGVKGTARQFDPVTGQVFTKANDNKTVDIGKYMINEYYHGKTATKMGYDLTKEKDNEEFAYYLYETKGTEPWVHSKSCWNM